jgi:hypothetical protein
MAIVSKKCNRCRKPMRNDGTEEQPKWVCNNPKCVKYVPPEPEPEPEPTPEPAPEPEQTAEE